MASREREQHITQFGLSSLLVTMTICSAVLALWNYLGLAVLISAAPLWYLVAPKSSNGIFELVQHVMVVITLVAGLVGFLFT